MKIYDGNLAGGAAEAGRTQDLHRIEQGRTGKTGGAGKQNSGDRVEFSAGLGQLARAISAYGAERSHRVEELASLYQGGAYREDSAATGRAMIAEVLRGGGE